MSSIEKELKHMQNKCHICNIPLEELEEAFSQEKLGEIFHFCSQSCLDKFPEDDMEFDGEME